MAKRGRKPKVKEDVMNTTQLALNQVEIINRVTRIEMNIATLVRSVEDYVNSANKINQDIAKKLQIIEGRVGDLEKKASSESILANDRVLSENEN